MSGRFGTFCLDGVGRQERCWLWAGQVRIGDLTAIFGALGTGRWCEMRRCRRFEDPECTNAWHAEGSGTFVYLRRAGVWAGAVLTPPHEWGDPLPAGRRG